MPASQTVSNLSTAIDSIPSGAAKETWVIKSDAGGEFATTQISFTSNGKKFTSIGANYADLVIILRYDNNEIANFDPGASAGFEFYNEAYRKLTFDTSPTGALLTWLQSNAVKQPDGTAVQDTKALTITSNGTVSVTPDAPDDGLSSVDVMVDVASGGGSQGGFSVTFPAAGSNNYSNWSSFIVAYILKADGTVLDIKDYTVVAGKTIDGVVLFTAGDTGSFGLKFTFEGKVTLFQPGLASDSYSSIMCQTFNDTTVTNRMWTYIFSVQFFIPNSDLTITSISAYNTD